MFRNASTLTHYNPYLPVSFKLLVLFAEVELPLKLMLFELWETGLIRESRSGWCLWGKAFKSLKGCFIWDFLKVFASLFHVLNRKLDVVFFWCVWCLFFCKMMAVQFFVIRFSVTSWTTGKDLINGSVPALLSYTSWKDNQYPGFIW